MPTQFFHDAFDKFQFAFEPKPEPHCYHVHIFGDGYGRGTLSRAPQTVTFKQHDISARAPPLPDPNSLRAHYVLCKIFNTEQCLKWGLTNKIEEASD
ncbi:uncharacterized protein QC763_706935 [Podospora pseudopauciseta]|uniref:Plastocyanin-like domain-containing protein n=1 Tax=Podospora pseudopauciseta TaxID=2093780 RepID=A0ABR0H1C1_9PEZI|nr:hypothetical protein QC763_706935 [Podospora pseudopauciseta]